MVKYFVSYDLRHNRDYQQLYEALCKFKSIQVLQSVWCFEFQDDRTEELRNHLRAYMEEDDGLIIIKSAFWASTNLNTSPNKL